MPKATTVASASTPAGRAALRRNQACRPCRRRKLKCDASRPHCGTCVKQWQTLVSVPAPSGYAHPPEPQCSYDPVDGLPLAPDADPMERIRALEQELSQLKTRLGDSSSSSDSSSPSRTSAGSAGFPITFDSNNSLSLDTPELPQWSYGQRGSMAPEPPVVGNISAEPYANLLLSGWNTDLPDRPMMKHLAEVFFRCDPSGSRILHRPSFLASLDLHPKDPDFPSAALLHAICASTSRWVSHDLVTSPDGSRRDPFAEYHASKTRSYIDRTMATGENIFPVLQACILLSWYFYTEGRWVEVWVFAGFQTRVSIPLRLNFPGTFTVATRDSPGAYLPAPRSTRELELRRRTWWMTVMFDRIVSMGGWVHSIDESDIGTELPLRMDDFDDERPVPANSQGIATGDLFNSHPPAYTDSFILFLKCMLLFGRVTQYNVRHNLRSSAPTAPTDDPIQQDGFEALDKLLVDFYDSFPSVYKTSFGLTESPINNTLDVDLYMLHVAPHAAAISLHSPYLDMTDRGKLSTQRCLTSSQAILSTYYMLTHTSLDISRLHPFVTICWYLAAVVQVHVCKHSIERGDLEGEAAAWEQINVLRVAMLEYGKRCPIGTRQEKLLQGLMAEIVRLTSQQHPMHVGLPLFPFSHATAFSTHTGSSHSSGEHSPPVPPVAPLPGGSSSH